MTGNHFFTHCRTHLKAWISLVVIVQCLLLVSYLVLVSDKDPSQQPPLVSPGHMTLSNGYGNQGNHGILATDNERARIRNQVKNLVKEYPLKQPQTQKLSSDHLKLQGELKKANDVLYKKIGGGKKKRQSVNLAEKKELVLKKALQQARWAEKAERHRIQKLKGTRSRIRTRNSSRTDFTTTKGSKAVDEFYIRLSKKDENKAVNNIGRELKRFSSEKVRHQSESKNKLYKSFISSKQPNKENEKTALKTFTTSIISNQLYTSQNKTTSYKNLDISAIDSKNHTFTSINITDGVLHTPLVSIPSLFHLHDVVPSGQYFEIRTTSYSTYQCYKPGTKPKIGPDDFLCACKKGWHGKWCSFPDSLYYSTTSGFLDGLRLRSHKRRIVNAIPFNIEWELLEARLHELNDTVDVFILMESNYTMFGDHKPLRLLERFQQGYLKEYHHKILYLYLDHFPEGGRQDGWIEDHYIRTFLSQEGLRRISGLRPDDLFISTDADELPTASSLAFLALHDGYPEPFGFALRWSVFGFFWRQYDATKIYTGCTVRMLREVFHDDIYVLRTQEYHEKYASDVSDYVRRHGRNVNVSDWILGDHGVYAGWHCSWCLSPSRIKTKLTSAINADFPRWGDYPQKMDLEYIRKLIRTGTWFDDTTKFGALVTPDKDPHFAPDFLLDNFEKYKMLLDITEV